MKCDFCKFRKNYKTGSDEYPPLTEIETCMKGHWVDTVGKLEGSESIEQVDYWADCKDYQQKQPPKGEKE